MSIQNWIGYRFPLAAAIFLAATAGLMGQTPERAADEVVVERDVDQGLMLIKIPAKEGKIAWEDVLRTLLRVGHMDDNVLKDEFPSGSLDLNRSTSRYGLMLVNLTMPPEIRMRIVGKTDQQEAHLEITVNEDKIKERKRRLSKKVRDRITGGEVRSGKFGLQLKEGTWESNPTRPLVIIVHGFNSSPQRFEPLAEALRDIGFVAATYSYPDDQPIAESAQRLADDLKGHATRFPQRPIHLVTHSMGGLVSRSVIEHPDLDPGTVTKLIMIAPPSHGSLLAHVAFGIDILDHAPDGSIDEDVTRFYAAVEDGLSEARHDLKPHSPFLKKLNSLSRNAKVKYSIFLGTGGHLKQPQIDRLRTALSDASRRSKTVGLFTPHLDQSLGDLDEVIAGKGDGVVAVKRGRLEGVSDTVLADFTHLSVLQAPGAFAGDPVFQGVIERLRSAPTRY